MESPMKRIETVITPWSLDTFKEVAPKLGISEFNLVEVFSTGCTTVEKRKRIYRGTEYTTDLLPRLKLEFVLSDDDVKATLHQLLELVCPESIAVFKLDQTIWPANGNLTSSLPLADATNRPTGAAIRQIVGLAPRKSDKDSDHGLDITLRTAADDGNNWKAR
jgi:nitrogen regulatory protein PII